MNVIRVRPGKNQTHLTIGRHFDRVLSCLKEMERLKMDVSVRFESLSLDRAWVFKRRSYNGRWDRIRVCYDLDGLCNYLQKMIDNNDLNLRKGGHNVEKRDDGESESGDIGENQEEVES